jgi:hypothetical protein
MMTGSSGDVLLSADIAGARQFIAIGRMHTPFPAFVTALRGLQNGASDSELRDILVYTLAANISGLCALEPGAEQVLQNCLAAGIVSEWQIALPGLGVLQALYLVARLRPAKDAAQSVELALQLAGKRSLRAPEAGGADPH